MSEEVKTAQARGPRRGGRRQAQGFEDEQPDRPQTTRGRGGYGKGNRGGERGRGGKRPQTAREEGREDGAEETKGEKKPRAQQNRTQDKNSWIYKYHNMAAPQYERITFTAETEIPEMPPPKDRLKEPSKADFDRELRAQDELIKEQRAKKDALIKKRREIREGGLSANGNTTIKGEFKERINTVRELRNQKQSKNVVMKQYVAEMDALDNEKRDLLKQMHPDYRTVESAEQAVKQMERRLTTTTMSGQQESRLIKEIDQLKGSFPKVQRYQEIEGEMSTLKTKKGKIWGEIKELRAKEDVLNQEMEKIRKELEETNQEKDETRAKADAASVEIDEADKALNELYKAKDAMREAFWKAKYDHKKQREEIQHIEWMQRQKDKVLQAQRDKKEREEERKEAISNLPHPYLKEMDTCAHLLNFLQSLKVRYGLVAPDSETVARQTQTALAQEAVKDRMDQKLAAGKVEVAKTKAEREAENAISIGGGKKRRGKKQKAEIVVEDTFNIDLVMIQKFSLVGVTAPVVPEELDDRIKQIKERNTWYEQNGVSKLQEQIEDFNRMADEEEKLFEQENQAHQEESRGRGRGRGAYGRGGRGTGTGRGRGRGRGGYQARNEFDNEVDEEDDWAYQAPVAKPARAKASKE